MMGWRGRGRTEPCSTRKLAPRQLSETREPRGRLRPAVVSEVPVRSPGECYGAPQTRVSQGKWPSGGSERVTSLVVPKAVALATVGFSSRAQVAPTLALTKRWRGERQWQVKGVLECS